MDDPETSSRSLITTQERVDILQTVSLFRNAQRADLAEVADLLEEVAVEMGQTVFEKGDLGSSVYIVVRGLVRVHDGDKILNYLSKGDVFGEMAILDPGPRSASVTAVEKTLLFCLDQAPFRQLQAKSPEVTEGIIHMLSSRLRARMQDVKEVYEELRRYHENLEELVAERTGELMVVNDQAATRNRRAHSKSRKNCARAKRNIGCSSAANSMRYRSVTRRARLWMSIPHGRGSTAIAGKKR